MTTEQEWAALKEAVKQCPVGGLVTVRPLTILALEAEHNRLRAENERLRGVVEAALEYWRNRQQRYRNRHPVWVQRARAALAQEGE